MKIEAEKPAGCRAEIVGQVVNPKSSSDEEGRVMIICGDREMDFPISYDLSRGIKFSQEVYQRDRVSELAAEVICGFCINCPNRSHFRRLFAKTKST